MWDYKNYQINSIIIKTTDCCNLKCNYCYLKDKNTNITVHMDLGMIEKIIQDYFEYSEENDLDDILYIVWHGGEPLICPIGFYEKVIEIEKKIIEKKSGRKIINAIQTNGTLFTPSVCRFLKANNFIIGISIDGIQQHHDVNRVNQNGKGSYLKIVNGIKLLNEYNINFSSICVINKLSVGYETEYYNMFKKLGAAEVDFIPSFYQNSEFNLTNKEYSDFLIKMFDIYNNDSKRKMKIRVFDDILRAILSEKGIYCGSIGCEYAGRCGENISIAINGDVYPCDCLENISKLVLGNIKFEKLSSICSTKKFEYFKKNVSIIPEECCKCDLYSICKGGCFNRRINNFDLNENDFCKDIYCEARKDIINHIEQNYRSVK